MTLRVRHCVECPECLTRYLVGFSPYRNGSYLRPANAGYTKEWTLHCSCGRPAVCSKWNWNELRMYAIPKSAHDRGYGPPEEIVPLAQVSRPGDSSF